MCRFSVSLQPPPKPDDGLAELLEGDDDGFNWFDAIDELPELVPQDALAPVVQETDSSSAPGRDACSTEPMVQAPAGSGSSTSSYDLVEMFKQQVEQQAPCAIGSAVPVAQSFQPQFVGALPFAAMPQQQLMCGIAGPFVSACVAPAFLPAAALAGTPAVLNNNVGTPSTAVAMTGIDSSAAADISMEGCRSGSAPGSSCGRRRGNKTQEEIDAAVERIKQKRRESAQRSRARKNDYMRQLELENQALKDEVQRLQQVRIRNSCGSQCCCVVLS